MLTLTHPFTLWAFKKVDLCPLDARGGACDPSQAVSTFCLSGHSWSQSIWCMGSGAEKSLGPLLMLRGMKNEWNVELPTVVLMKDLHGTNPEEVELSRERNWILVTSFKPLDQATPEVLPLGCSKQKSTNSLFSGQVLCYLQLVEL